MDRAVSPFANFVKILVVAPPGQQDRIISPTAISFVRLKILIIKNKNYGIVTLPFNKKNILSEKFKFSGLSEYFAI